MRNVTNPNGFNYSRLYGEDYRTELFCYFDL